MKEFDEDLREVITRNGLDPAALEGNAFLNTVLMHEIDENNDQLISRDELLFLQIKAERCVEIKPLFNSTITVPPDHLKPNQSPPILTPRLASFTLAGMLGMQNSSTRRSAF